MGGVTRKNLAPSKGKTMAAMSHEVTIPRHVRLMCIRMSPLGSFTMFVAKASKTNPSSPANIFFRTESIPHSKSPSITRLNRLKPQIPTSTPRHARHSETFRKTGVSWAPPPSVTIPTKAQLLLRESTRSALHTFFTLKSVWFRIKRL